MAFILVLHHNVCLLSDGHIFAWGANNHGQLGIGRVSHSESKPVIVKSLAGIPIAFLACGGDHSFAVSCSGAVFGWGKFQ